MLAEHDVAHAFWLKINAHENVMEPAGHSVFICIATNVLND